MMRSARAPLLLLVLLLSVDCCTAKTRDRNVPHVHKGKLTPYTPGPFRGVTLTSSDEATLQSGQPVTKQTVPADPSKAGTVLCIQDVQAPVAAVWHQILDMDQYSKKVSKVTECRNYFVSKLSGDGRMTIKTKQVLGVLPGYSFESYYDHTFYPSRSSLIWQLDYDKTSDLDDVAGHWHVAPHPTQGPNWSRVFYACDVQMKGVVPTPLLNYMSKTALRQATAWVKRESESHRDRTVTSQYGGHLFPSAAAVDETTTKSKVTTASSTTASTSTRTASPLRLWGRK